MSWEELPEKSRREIERHTGPVTDARPVSAGRNSAVAAILHTRGSMVFAKGLHHTDPRLWTQDMEEMINPYVLGVSPRLLWRIQGEWDILGFAYLDGRHADYSPDSSDIPHVIHTFTRLGDIPCPDLPLKRPEHRWNPYVRNPADLECLQGDRLLHIDPTPPNLIINSDGANLVDWAWPTRGASWIDPACLVIRLIEAGHTAEQAEAHASRIPAWTAACPRALNLFAQANSRMWSQVADGRPLGITKAARTWAEYRAAQ